MVVSFKLSRRGRRFYPPIPADDPPPPAASPDGSPLPPPPPPPPPLLRDAAEARLGSGIAARSDVPGRSGTDPVDLDLEPSFVLNLFPDGYSIGEPGKGMLLFLIGDDPEKQPYNRASKALLSDIEYGFLPRDILHGIPCKFQNGTIVCEVRDYRSFLSNGGDSSGYDFPKMNRVALRLGFEFVVKDLPSIADASCTYHDQLIAESTIINTLQPRLNLDPTPCLERFCNSVVKKIDLGINKGRQHTIMKDLPSIADTSHLNISAIPPEKSKLKGGDACEGKAVCIDKAALEVSPHGVLNNSLVNCPTSLQINNANSTVVSDPNNTIQHSCTLRNSSALRDSQQNASNTPASGRLIKSHEQRAQVAVIQADPKNGQSRRETVPQKRKQSSDLPREMHERQNGRSSNNNARLSFQSSKCQFQKSMGTSNKQRLELGSPKEPRVKVKVDLTICNNDMRVQQHMPLTKLPTNRPLPSRNTPCLEKHTKKVKLGSAKDPPVEVKVDHTIGSKDMRVHQQKHLSSLLPTNRPLSSLDRNTPWFGKIPEKMKVSSPKELPVDVKVDHTIVIKDTRGQQYQPLSIIPTNNQHPSLNRKNPFVERIPETLSSSHIRMKGRHQVPIIDLDNSGVTELKDSRIPPITSCNASSRKEAGKPHEDKAAPEPQPITSKRKVSVTSTVSLNQNIDLKGKRQKKANIHIKPPCENISSVEPGVTDGTSSQLGISPDIELCIGDPLHTAEPDIEKILSEVILTTQRHGLNLKAAKTDDLEASMPLSSSCSSSKFFRYESAEGNLYKQEEINTCYLTRRTKSTRNIRRLVFHRVQYFCRGIIDQSHCILCLIESEALDDHQIAVGTIFEDEHIHIATLPTSDHANKFVDQFILLMKRDGYTLCNATICNGFSRLRQQFEDVSQLGYPTGEYPQYRGFSPYVPKSVVINESKDTSFSFQNRLPDVRANVLQQGCQQWGLPDTHANHQQQENQQLGMPDVHANVLHQVSQQLGLPDVHANVLHQGYQQWGLPDVHANVLQQGRQQWVPTEQSPTLGVGKVDSLNPRHLVELQYNSRVLQDQGLPFASGVRSMDLDQYLYVDTSEIDMDQYFQHRHDIPRFSERDAANMSTNSYDQQYKTLPPQLEGMYQWDFQDFGRQLNTFPPPHARRSILLSALHPVGSPQINSQTTGSNDATTVTSTPIHLPAPPSYQYLSQGIC